MDNIWWNVNYAIHWATTKIKKFWLDISGLFLMIENPLHINIFPLIIIRIKKDIQNQQLMLVR